MTSIRRFLSHAALGAFAATLSFASISHAQVRQTNVYIDNGSGAFTDLKGGGAGTITFPAATGFPTINTSAGIALFTGPTLGNTWTYTLPDASATLATTAMLSGGTLAGSFTTLTSSGNSTIGTGASTTNTFGNGGATLNNIGDDATNNWFGRDNTATSMTNNFGLTSNSGNTLTNLIGISTQGGATVNTQIGNGGTDVTVSISSQNWSVTGPGAATFSGNLFVGGNITNNTDNNIGSTNQGQGAPVINWDANAPGYAGLITNEDATDAGAAGLLVKVYNNNSTTAALDVSQNSGINAGIRLFTVFADGSIGGHDWSVDNSGNIAATSFSASGTPGFSGDGSGLTNVPDGALSSNVAILNGNQTFTGTNTFSNPIAGDITGNAATVTTDANLTGDVTSVGNVTTIANVPDGALSSNVALLNGNQTFTGTNTFSNPIAGDITGNAATVTTDANLTGDVTSVGNVTTIANVPDGALSSNVALLNGNQTFTGTNTFSNPIAGDITGNAATVTTDANLTGDVTSVGNVTTIANVPDGALSSNVAILNGNQTFTGTNTFSNPIAGDITGNAATVTTDANLTGDVTSVGNVTTIANVPDGALSSNVAILNGNQTFTGTNTFSNPIAGDITGNAATVTTDANLTGDVTSVGNVTTIANVPDGALSSNVALLNGNQTFTGTNTFSNPIAGDITGNAATVTTDANLTGDVTSVGNVTTIANVPDGALSSNVALLNGNQTFTGTNTFSNPIAGDITGNAATVTTDANLTGDVTSVGNVTTIANVPDGALSSNVAILNGNQTFTGTNTFSNPIAGDITGNAATVTTDANLTGDVTSVGNVTTIANVPDGALSSNVALLNGNQTFTGTNTFSNPIAGDITGTSSNVTGIIGLANGGTAVDNASIGDNLVFAGPITGGPGAAGFRALDPSDLPAGATGYVLTAPGAAQTIQPTVDAVPLILKAGGPSSDLQDWEASDATKLASIDASGDVSMLGDLNVTGGDIESSVNLEIQNGGNTLTLGNSDGITMNGPVTFTNTEPNDIVGTSSSWSVTKAGAATFNSDVSTGGHVISTGTVGAASAPVTVPANDVSAQSVLGSDVAGVVTLSTTEATGVGSVAVAFTAAYASVPVVIITPANAAAVGSIANLYVSTSTSGFTINFADFTNVSGANFNYIVVQP